MISTFDKKTGRNAVGATPFQMDFLRAGTKSKNKTEKKYKPDIKDFFNEQTYRIILRYNDYFKIKAIDPQIAAEDIETLINYIFPLGPENVALKQKIKPLHTSGVQKAIEDIGSLSDEGIIASATMSNISVATSVLNLGERITRINNVTRNLLRDVITQGVADGRNIYDIAADIQDTGLGEWYANRSLAIARTETRMAYDAGGKIAYKELGAETFSIIGCISVMAGENDLGVVPGYGQEFNDKSGTCGSLTIGMSRWDEASGLSHVNHTGCMVADTIPM